MSYDLTVRCPICLTSKQVPKNTPTGRTIDCRSCNKHFSLHTALPGEQNGQGASSSSTRHASRNSRHSVSRLVYLFGFIGLIYSVLGVSVTHSLGDWNGRGYIYLFAAYIYLGQKMVWYLYDQNHNGPFSGVANLWFAGTIIVVALLRYFVASEKGMEDFLFLLLLSLVGVVVCFVRVDNDIQSNGRRSGGDCSSCSGCGSSCGGGCGGCG